MNIYVGNLSRDVSSEDLRDRFEAFGEVTDAYIIRDKMTKEPRGFGFVEMPDEDQAHRAIDELNGKLLNGQNITVKEALPKRETLETGARVSPRGGGNRRR